jgi:hypothetical protein
LQQREIRSLLDEIPSLLRHAEGLFKQAYNDAVQDAAAETGMPASRFPGVSPWALEEALAYTPLRIVSSYCSRLSKF